MKSIDRALVIDLPPRQSAFLWGARKTGKTTYLRQRFPTSIVYDFLKTDVLLDMTRNPAQLREQLLARRPDEVAEPVILDEVQKVPLVLDEVHWLIENTDLRFILCGSSARKLKRGGANLLGGRAWRYQMHPLTSHEVPNLDLLQALNRGLVPTHYLPAHGDRSLKAYVVDYLKEEVFDEGLTRNAPAFSRFFEAMSFAHGQLVNYANIARDCGVDAKTVREYYQILVDTLLGTMLMPFKRRQNRQVIGRTPKFYLFDVGVAGHLQSRKIARASGESFGRALEHFVLMEILAHRSYAELDYAITFWRTKTGLEVDFVLGDGEVAIEVKGADRVDSRDLRPLNSFIEDYGPRRAYMVCNESARRMAGKVLVIPWRDFLADLWRGEVLT